MSNPRAVANQILNLLKHAEHAISEADIMFITAVEKGISIDKDFWYNAHMNDVETNLSIAIEALEDKYGR